MEEETPNLNNNLLPNDYNGANELLGRVIIEQQNNEEEINKTNLSLSGIINSINSLRQGIVNITSSIQSLSGVILENTNTEQKLLLDDQKRENTKLNYQLRLGAENRLEEKIQNSIFNPVEKIQPKLQETFNGINDTISYLLTGLLSTGLINSIKKQGETGIENLAKIKTDILSNIDYFKDIIDGLQNNFYDFSLIIKNFQKRIEEYLNIFNKIKFLKKNPDDTQPPSPNTTPSSSTNNAPDATVSDKGGDTTGAPGAGGPPVPLSDTKGGESGPKPAASMQITPASRPSTPAPPTSESTSPENDTKPPSAPSMAAPSPAKTAPETSLMPPPAPGETPTKEEFPIVGNTTQMPNPFNPIDTPMEGKGPIDNLNNPLISNNFNNNLDVSMMNMPSLFGDYIQNKNINYKNNKFDTKSNFININPKISSTYRRTINMDGDSSSLVANNTVILMPTPENRQESYQTEPEELPNISSNNMTNPYVVISHFFYNC